MRPGPPFCSVESGEGLKSPGAKLCIWQERKQKLRKSLHLSELGVFPRSQCLPKVMVLSLDNLAVCCPNRSGVCPSEGLPCSPSGCCAYRLGCL